MFSAVNHSQTFKPGSVIDRRGALQIQTREPIRSIKLYLMFLAGNGKKRHCENQKHAKQHNEYYST